MKALFAWSDVPSFLLYMSLQFGWQALHFASYNGHLKMVQKLHIKCKCQPDEPAKVGAELLGR